ncbi:MAG TPA: hypothetical protein VES02_09555 [Dermatophilaceae bacterium]|nr:hypothetical protein [Dermatophilaceae bacterium]
MRYLYARCMDGHYFRLETYAVCPLDGSAAGAAGLAAVALGTPVSLEALAASGLSGHDFEELAVFDLPDGAVPPQLLYPES